MTIPDAGVSLPISFNIHAAGELFNGIRYQDAPNDSGVGLKQALEPASTAGDVLIVSTPMPQTPDPTTSALFQSHIGSVTHGSGFGNHDHLKQMSGEPHLRVAEVKSTAAAGAFTTGEPLQSDVFQYQIPSAGIARTVPLPALNQSMEVPSSFDAQRRRWVYRPVLGSRMDFQG